MELRSDVLDEPQSVAELGAPRTKVPLETQLPIRIMCKEEDGTQGMVLGRYVCIS